MARMRVIWGLTPTLQDCETLIDSMVTVVVAMHTHTKNAQNKADTIATWDTLKTAMQTAGSQDQVIRVKL